MSRHKETELSTRDRLIAAAITIIESEGEVALRVDRVAEAAGFTKPVLYHHFTDREGIIAAAQAERFRRSLETGIDEATALVEAASSPEEFIAAMRNLLKFYSAPDGEARRRFRAEVLGSAISRPELMVSVIAANRAHIDKFEMPMRIAEARGWLKPGVPIRDFAHWWVGLVFTRFLFEIDPEGFNPASWDAITDDVMQSLVFRD
jgi:AcrR family transcriptional regulator